MMRETLVLEGHRARVKTLSHVSGRVLVVGDIHGCLTQLKQLLQKAQMNIALPSTHATTSASVSSSSPVHTSDLCVFVGDLVNKGPDSFGVVRFLRDIGAVGVLGNHDALLVDYVANMKAGIPFVADKKSSLYKLAQSCPQDVYDYLRQLPHILRLPQFNVIVVHAGLDPTLPLKEQRAEVVLSVRNFVRRQELMREFATMYEAQQKMSILYLPREPYVGCRGNALCAAQLIPLEDTQRGGPWAAVWDEAVRRGTAADPLFHKTTVVFGHDARRRLQKYDYALGIDTSCGHGGPLTGLILPGRHYVSVAH